MIDFLSELNSLEEERGEDGKILVDDKAVYMLFMRSIARY